MKRRLLILLIILVVSSGPSQAVTWTVELDGTGDFTNIQPAVEAAAGGDTVMIGPGRFDTLFSYTPPGGGWTDDAIVGIDGKDMTLIGSGIDVTIIGPEVPLPWGMPGPVGIAWINGTLSISGLSIENMRDGLYHSDGGLAITQVKVHQNYIGLSLSCNDTVVVTACSFRDNRDGIFATRWGGDPRLEVVNCEFVGRIYGFAGMHVSAQSLNDVLIDSCTFREGIISVQFEGSPGVIRNCIVESGQGPHFGLIGSHSELYDNTVLGDGVQIVATNGGWLVGSGNVFAGDSGIHPTSGTIEISNVDVELHGNHILKAPGIGYVVKCESMCSSTIDLSDNYWGRVDPGWFDLFIYDGNDTADITTIVGYAPYSNVPLPNEDMSWSEIKDLFR